MNGIGKIIAGVIFACMLSGCAANKENAELPGDAKGIAADILQKVSFSDELYEISSETAHKLYEIDEKIKCVCYTSTGATAEELAVFELPEDVNAEELLDSLKARAENLAALYASYLPDEVYKLENSIMTSIGRFVVLCVTADTENAQRVVEGYSQ